MAQKIQIKRGLKANLPALDVGELALCTDTNELFLGSSSSNVEITAVNLTGSFQTFTNENVQIAYPNEVRRLMVTDTTKTSISLSWLPSRSINKKDYTIYVNDVLFGNSANTNYQITGLTASTTYKVTIKTRDTNNVESPGMSTNQRTIGNYALQLGTNQYVTVPTISFNSIEITTQFTTKPSWNNAILTGMTSATPHSLSAGSDGTLWTRNYFPTMYLNGVSATGSNYVNNWSYTIPQNVKQVIRMDAAQDDLVVDNYTLFATKTFLSDMTATLYRIKLFQLADDGTRLLTSDYDFSYSTSGIVSDYLGNGPDMTIHSGTFISN